MLALLLTLVIAVNLCCVVVLDAADEFVEQLDELCGGAVGEARKQEGQDDSGTNPNPSVLSVTFLTMGISFASTD